MTIGRKLSELSPEERRQENLARKAIHEAATAIAHEYINEIQPLLGRDRPPSSLSPARPERPRAHDCDRIFLEYADSTDTLDEPLHVFSALFRAGLLASWTWTWRRGGRCRSSCCPVSAGFEHGDGLPESSHYLVHPILTSLIAEDSPPTCGTSTVATEIGSGAHGSRTGVDESLCAVRADILHFSAFIRAGARETQVRDALHHAIEKAARAMRVRPGGRRTRSCCCTASPAKPSAWRRAFRSSSSRRRAKRSFGSRWTTGVWGSSANRTGEAVACGAGSACFGTLARIEPLVEPSQIWVTGRFKDALEQAPSFYRAESIELDVRADIRSADGRST